MIRGLDTETTPISSARPIPQLVSASLFGADGSCHTFVAHDPRAPQAIADAFEGGIAGVNTPFDVFALLGWCPELEPVIWAAYEAERVHHVDVREALIDIAEGEFYRRGTYGLKDIARRRCDIGLAKGEDTWRLRYGELLGLELAAWPPEARRYAELDAWAHLAGFLSQEAHPDAARILPNAGAQACAHLALYSQTIAGMYTDPIQVEKVDRRLAEEIADLSERVLRAGLARWQGVSKPKLVRNTKLASEMLIELSKREGFAVTMTTRGASLSEDELEKARIPRGHPLDSYRRLGSVQSTRKRLIPARRHPVIRTRYEPVVETGRTSSSAPGGIWPGDNLQNQPRKGGFREMLVAPPAWVRNPFGIGTDVGPWKLVISDVSGAELVTLAQIQVDWFGSSKLGDAIREGRNVHAELGMQLIHLDPRTYNAEIATHKNARSFAKPVNFGFPGGLGPDRMVEFARTQYHVEMSVAEAKQAKRVWLSAWPEMGPYLEAVSRQFPGRGSRIQIVSPRSGRVRGNVAYTEACNGNFQGLAADAIKLALWWVHLACRGFGAGGKRNPLYGCWQVLFVHDEIVLVAPASRCEEARAELDRIMVSAFRVWCPDIPATMESECLDRYPGK